MYPTPKSKPDISTFQDFRSYLRAAVEFKRAQNSKFSLAYYSRRLGLSDAYLKLVTQGRRRLPAPTAYKLARALGLAPAERAYFLQLVLENDSGDAGLRRHYRSQRQELGGQKVSYTENQKLLSIFEDSVLWELYSLIGIKDFRADPDWIAKKLKNPQATRAQIQIALEKLLQMGVVEKSPNGKLKAQNIVVPRRFNPVRAYSTALQRAQVQLGRGLGDSAYFDSLCLILNTKQYGEITSLLEETKRQIGEIITREGEAKTHIAYFNANLFLASTEAV